MNTFRQLHLKFSTTKFILYWLKILIEDKIMKSKTLNRKDDIVDIDLYE